MGCFRGLLMVYLVLLSCIIEASEAELSKKMLKKMKKVNREGPFVGVLVPSKSLLEPVLQSSSYESEDKPYDRVDYAGRRFHIGEFEDKSAILAVTGKGMRYGDGPEDKLSLEEDGDFTREYGYLNFGNYTYKTKDDDSADNFLNNIWYQPEEIFHSEEDPDSKSKTFWVPVCQSIYEFTRELEASRTN
ncbi:uncharacterized protein LOC122672136 [Telopea speciosissima]|uniref:uncharacterized protein LOC122672136 n=1 Tax=Telopea speciosissima TaxID=54955 RepID=UPI001CC5AF43|nr:uncharacterized protein LOC122672136 [Telopea speciosissima]